LFDFTVYSLQVYSSFLLTYELHISLSGRKRKKHNIFIALVRIHKYHIYWETWECHIIKSLSFILKIYKKNSRTMVEQRTWDIVFDLIVLSFSCSRPKWRLRSPMVKGNMSKFESQTNLFQSRGEFLIERMYTFEAWKYCSNSWSIAKFSFAQGWTKVKLGAACWWSLMSIRNHEHNQHMYLILSPNIGIGV
jgi:hypothetical protein